ncbi:MAG: hypothetical protein Kow0065_17300 [Methylomicrobium sp.]
MTWGMPVGIGQRYITTNRQDAHEQRDEAFLNDVVHDSLPMLPVWQAPFRPWNTAMRGE